MTTPLRVPDEMVGEDDVPDDVKQLIGVGQYPETGDFPVERGYIWTSCASVENGNPLFWDDDVAAELTDGPIAPPTMLSVWFRPHHWAPGRTAEHLPLKVHFDLKERFGLPEAVMTDNTIVFHDPVRPGDVLHTRQVLRSVSPPKTTKLGAGRFWVIDVEYRNQADDLVGVESYTGFGYRREAASDATPAPSTTSAGPAQATGPAYAAGATTASPTDAPAAGHRLLLGAVQPGDPLPSLAHPVTATTVVLGALAARDWRPMHHDHDFAVNRNGTRDIFLNTPNQAAWFERYLTDWSGPTGRLGRMQFRMKGSVFPGDTMVLAGQVESVETDATSCGWATVAVGLTVDGDVKTTCTARIALPIDAADNPWRRAGDRWRPDATNPTGT